MMTPTDDLSRFGGPADWGWIDGGYKKVLPLASSLKIIITDHHGYVVSTSA